MATQANLTMTDGQSPTPVSHTFVASGVDGNQVATWLEKSASIFQGFYRFTTQIRLPKKQGDPVRHTAKLVVPTVVSETINGVTYAKVSRQALVSVDIVMPSDSTTQERLDVCAYMAYTFGSPNTSGQLAWQVKNQEGVV